MSRLGSLAAWDTDNGTLNVVIETPKGSRNKFDYDESLELFRYGKTLPAGSDFPFDFGFVPSTAGADGDPLDILVLMDAPAFPGCLVAARLVGVVEAEQTERDGSTSKNDRLIAVAAKSRQHRDVRSLADLGPVVLDEIEHFFVSYNRFDDKEFRPLGRSGPERARELVENGERAARRLIEDREGAARQGQDSEPVRLRGVLLDVDGTLVLSVDAHARAWAEAFDETGYDVPPERVRPLIGMGGDRVLPQLVPGLNDAEDPGKSIAERRRELFLETHAPRLEAARGARELLERMKADGLRLVAASSAKQDELGALLEAARVEELIETATTSDDAESSKPAPDIVQAALERSGLRPDEVLMLGDSPYDIESAKKAGVAVVALRCGGFPESTLDGAVAVYDDPAHLLREYDHSPFAVTGSGRRARGAGQAPAG